jgi:2Fe-2S ferredoxin
MALLYDQIPVPYFGECGGMGRCGTCTVTISSSKPVTGLDRNEQATLAKSGRPYDPSHRLSCQILVDPSLHQSEVRILTDQV